MRKGSPTPTLAGTNRLRSTWGRQQRRLCRKPAWRERPAPARLWRRIALRTESQANGALMRVSPLGVYGAGFRTCDVFFGQIDASLTHPHAVCCDASGWMAAVLAHAIREGGSASEVYGYGRELSAERELAGPVRMAIAKRQRRASHGNYVSKQGWVLIALQNACYQLLHAEGPEDGIRDTVRRGGDTDTNAAIAGALLGAVHGRDVIPQQWRDRILTCRPIPGLDGVEAAASSRVLAGRRARFGGAAAVGR